MTANNPGWDRGQIAKQIEEEYGVDRSRVFFLNERNPLEPWLPPDALAAIARKSGGFQTIEETFDQFIPELNQVVHQATVIDEQGRVFKRSGVATIGEQNVAGEFDEHRLAAGRALGAALSDAGFNPIKTKPFKPVATFADTDPQNRADEYEQKNNDLAQIHILARQAGLIKENDSQLDERDYRKYLRETFKVGSAMILDSTQRASLINALRQRVVKQTV
ncbi:MAG: hypothetical protein WBV94_07360 [Blastocatellia bacterium]